MKKEADEARLSRLKRQLRRKNIAAWVFAVCAVLSAVLAESLDAADWLSGLLFVSCFGNMIALLVTALKLRWDSLERREIEYSVFPLSRLKDLSPAGVRETFLANGVREWDGGPSPGKLSLFLKCGFLCIQWSGSMQELERELGRLCDEVFHRKGKRILYVFLFMSEVTEKEKQAFHKLTQKYAVRDIPGSKSGIPICVPILVDAEGWGYYMDSINHEDEVFTNYGFACRRLKKLFM